MGKIQSIHSFSTVDGPGTRVVVFFQGCPIGCIFCHNPDSWDFQGGEEIDVEHLLRRLERFRPFLKSPGLTISGGEPLAQPEFALELTAAAKADGWHVALDTSGWGSLVEFQKVAGQADLIMFSVKHPLNPEGLSRCHREGVWQNWLSLAKLGKPVWLRYVLIPGWTDQPEALTALKEWAGQLPNLEKVEIFPYNGLAQNKWTKLGWDSPIFHDENLMVSETQIRAAEEILGITRPTTER
ncbi:MAG TPA: radical SAM protein [Bacillota bacterium]|nr:radical SAM protein [Bacillota bacterium]